MITTQKSWAKDTDHLLLANTLHQEEIYFNLKDLKLLSSQQDSTHNHHRKFIKDQETIKLTKVKDRAGLEMKETETAENKQIINHLNLKVCMIWDQARGVPICQQLIKLKLQLIM